MVKAKDDAFFKHKNGYVRAFKEALCAHEA